jgi:hypothetical protein
LPQGDAPFLQQVFVGQIAAVLPSQDKVHQPGALVQQMIQADPASALSADIGRWPI